MWSVSNLQIGKVARGTWKAMFEEKLFNRAAELAFYFLFALFPTLFSASSLLGLAARSAHLFYSRILEYLAIVVPTTALSTILNTFNETAAASNTGKLTFGLIAAIWSASVGVSAIQDCLNGINGIRESRSFLRARLSAIGLTIVLSVIFTLVLTAMLGADLLAGVIVRHIHDGLVAQAAASMTRVVGWMTAIALLALVFAIVYTFAPDGKRPRWRWVSSGAILGILGWLGASLGLRLYLTFFNNYSVTYGSLGAVILLLTWFYISALMLLIGAAWNHQLDADRATNAAPAHSPN
jgi:membrane protein